MRPAKPGDPAAAPYGASKQLLLFVVRLLQFTGPSLLLFKFSLCWRTGRDWTWARRSMRPPPYCHVKITRKTGALVTVVIKVCHTLYSEFVELYFADVLAHFDAIFLAASTSAVDWYKSRPHISFLSKVISVFVAANSMWTKCPALS